VTTIKLAMAALTIAVLIFIPAARADSVSTFTATNVVIPGGDGNETINVTFQFDDTTGTLVPGTMNLSTTGPLSGFVLTFVASEGDLFNWTSPGGELLQIDGNNEGSSTAGPLPDPGTYSTALLDIACLETTCENDGFTNGGDGSQQGVSGTFIVTVAETPEPGTWSMLLAGIALVGLFSSPAYMLRRRISLAK
jgi:hypothetical protein